MTDKLPELPHGCNSWIITDSNEVAVMETFSQATAQKLLDTGQFNVRTALDHLQRLNRNN